MLVVCNSHRPIERKAFYAYTLYLVDLHFICQWGKKHIKNHWLSACIEWREWCHEKTMSRVSIYEPLSKYMQKCANQSSLFSFFPFIGYALYVCGPSHVILLLTHFSSLIILKLLKNQAYFINLFFSRRAETKKKKKKIKITFSLLMK